MSPLEEFELLFFIIVQPDTRGINVNLHTNSKTSVNNFHAIKLTHNVMKRLYLVNSRAGNDRKHFKEIVFKVVKVVMRDKMEYQSPAAVISLAHPAPH